MQPRSRSAILASLRSEVARSERRAVGGRSGGCIPFGLAAVDQALPGGGLAAGALHEVAGTGAGTEHATAPALLAAGLLGGVPGTVLWVLERPDIHPPALAAVGLAAERVVYVHARKPPTVLLVMEEGLRQPGLAGVVGEFSGALSLTASRRLQLAAERSGVAAFLLRRSRHFDDPVLARPSAAVTRWRVAALPSGPPLAHAPETPGLGRLRWRLELVRCRGGAPRSWVVEACDAAGRCGLVADMVDRPAAAGRSLQEPLQEGRHAVA
jgi:protein ImuA